MQLHTMRPLVLRWMWFRIDEKGKNGHVYNKREGFCLETQVEPNAVNVEAFHSPVLEAGEKYQSFTAYKFDVRK